MSRITKGMMAVVIILALSVWTAWIVVEIISHSPQCRHPAKADWTARVRIVDVRDSDWNGRYTLVAFDEGRKFLDGRYGKIGDTFMLQSWQVKR